MPRIHDFEIIGAIGRGQFSEVHRALWKAGGDRVLVECSGIAEEITLSRRDGTFLE